MHTISFDTYDIYFKVINCICVSIFKSPCSIEFLQQCENIFHLTADKMEFTRIQTIHIARKDNRYVILLGWLTHNHVMSFHLSRKIVLAR